MAPAALVGALRQGVCLSLNVGALERASTSACRSVGTRALAAAAASSVAADARGLEQGGARLSVRAASRAAPGGPLQEKSGGGGDSSEGAGIGRGRIAGWACIERCGACCQLDKGELAPPIETILRDPSELAVYRSMVGADGWCRHYDKGTRTCRIYDSRPRFCRVEADVFWDLYRIAPHQLATMARSFCRVSIADVYGPRSDEMSRFKAANGKRPRGSQQR